MLHLPRLDVATSHTLPGHSYPSATVPLRILHAPLTHLPATLHLHHCYQKDYLPCAPLPSYRFTPAAARTAAHGLPPRLGPTAGPYLPSADYLLTYRATVLHRLRVLHLHHRWYAGAAYSWTLFTDYMPGWFRTTYTRLTGLPATATTQRFTFRSWDPARAAFTTAHCRDAFFWLPLHGPVPAAHATHGD